MLEAETEIASRDVAVLLKSHRDTLNSTRRDNEDTAARSENRHADRPARPINGETAFRTRRMRRSSSIRAVLSAHC